MRIAVPPQRRPRVRPARVALAALGAFVLLAILGTERAAAGSYTAVECHPEFGAGHRDAAWERTSRDFVGAAGCAQGGGGLAVTHRPSDTLAKRFGRWTFAAPAGTRLVKAAARAGGASAGGVIPELLARVGGDLQRFAVPAGQPRKLAWEGSGTALVASLECARAPRCSSSGTARLRIDRVRLRLEDLVPPSVSAAGTLVDGAVVRGVRQLDVSAGDLGGGVQRVSATVNGRPAGTSGPPCAVAAKVALRTVPCPPSVLAHFRAATAAAPFHQGRNAVRACAQDFATRGQANVRCSTLRVRVDNLCPVSPVVGGAHLAAGLVGAEHGSSVTREDRPRIAGRLVDSAGEPVEGARICVAATALVPGAAEHLLGAPVTDGSGRFSIPVPPGPARRFRVAYWPGESGVVERFAQIRFRARPRLEIRPRRALRNGERARFLVRLQPPLEVHRLVRVEALTGGRWVPVTGGRTGAGGAYRGSYRFHATHGRRVYRFRAVAPKQAGYPYAAGASAVRRVVVRG